MSKSMFQSSKGALLFAGSTLLGVALLVGSEDREGALLVAASEIERQSERAGVPADGQVDVPRASEGSGFEAAPRAQRPRPSRPVEEEEFFEFTPDEDLIDDTQGIDPTPSDYGYADPNSY